MAILSLQIQLFILIAIGFLLSKKGFITQATRKQLTNMVIYVILPCNIAHSFDIPVDLELLKQSGMVLVFGFLIQGMYAILNLFIWNPVKDEKQRISLKYGTLCSNAGFMGMPLAYAFFGSEGLLYASIALIPIRVMMWTSGLSMYTVTSKKTAVKTVVTHPCIIAVFVGFAIMFFPGELPQWFNNTLVCLSNCCTPLSMIVIGSIITDVDLKTVFSKLTLVYSSLRLVIFPVVIFGILFLLKVEPLARNILVVLAAMPAGSTTAMLALKYDKDAEFASKIICASTLLSLITLAVWAFLLT